MTRSAQVGLLIALVGLGGCCLLGVGVLAWAGLDAGSAPVDGVGAPPAVGDDDAQGVLYETAQGTFVAQAQVVQARAGLPAQPAGVWKEDKLGVALELGADGAYALAYQASGASGGVGYLERGRWSAQAPGLVLAPESLVRSSALVFADAPGVRAHAETEALPPGPPRGYEVQAALLDFVANWESPPRVARKEGLLLAGPPPPEYWTGGAPLSLALRRARLMPVER